MIATSLQRMSSILLKPLSSVAAGVARVNPARTRVLIVSSFHSYDALLQREQSANAASVSVAVRLAPCGKKLSVKWNGVEREPVFHGVWLRHNCQCPHCMSSSGQKTLDSVHLDPELAIVDTSIRGDTLQVKFSCGHTGNISLEWLRDHCYPQGENDSTVFMSNQPKVAETIPEMSTAELENDEGMWKWLMFLNEYGLCLLKDVPVEPSDQILKIAQKVYHPQKTIYGEIFDVISKENPVNIAYSSVALGYHMDLVYYESPPGLQLLHCLRADSCVEGGESLMLDALPVVEELRQSHAHHFHTLTRVPATFQKIHFEREQPVVMRYQRPHIAVDHNGKVVAITWSPPFEGPLSVPQEDVEDYYAAYTCLKNLFDQSNHKLVHRLVPSEALTFNNRRILHGRNHFTLNGGVRHLKGVYVNIDEFKSRFAVLCKCLDKDQHPVKHVLNHCSL